MSDADPREVHPLVQRAHELASRAHAAQRYGAHPYITHLDEVARVLIEFGQMRPEVLAAGYLHDVLEDTEVTRAQLVEAFGEEVATLVAFCTDAPGATRAERKPATYARMHDEVRWARLNPEQERASWIEEAVRVKLADRLANVRACVRGHNARLLQKYRDEQPTLRSALEQGEGTPPLLLELERLLAQ